MPTTAELREMSDCQFGHGVFVYGVGLVFVDHEDLVAYNWGGSRVGRLGLTRDGLDWKHSINLRKCMPDDGPWSFTITDFDGDLARLFAAVDESERQLGDVPIGTGLPIHPNDSLAARTELHGKNIGTERIGPAGERGLYPAPAGVTFAPKHSINSELLDLSGAPVSDNPIVWAGRRVVLYRVYRDHVTYPETSAGTVSWRPFSEAVRRQWGTLRDNGTVRGHDWTLEADGPEGLLHKPLAMGFQTTPVRAVADVTLSTTDGAREDQIAIQLETVGLDGVITHYGGYTGTLVGTTVDAIRDEVIAAIASAAAAATDAEGVASFVWNDQVGFHVAMENNGAVRIAVSETLPDDDGGKVVVGLSRKVWSLLGYDIELQSSLDQSPDEPRALDFKAATQAATNWDLAQFLNGTDYWLGIFRTGRFEWEDTGGSDNAGTTREYVPQYTGGTSVISPEQISTTGQVVRLADATLGLGASSSTVAHPGQNDRPVASMPGDPTSPIEINGTPCNRQGLWLLTGKRRFAKTEEEFDEAQVVRASWVAAGAQQDGLVSGDTIIVTEILVPRKFGFDRPQMTSDWISLETSADEEGGRLNALPLANLGYNPGSQHDWAHIVAQRIMYSTGTANGWTSYDKDPAAAQDPGDNEPSGTHTVVRDAEIAELGLAIPADFIHPPAAWQAAKEKVEADKVLYSKLAITPGYQAIDALRSLLSPAGFALHYRGGRYGIWCPADPVTQEDVEVVLDRISKRGRDRFVMSEQPIRKWQPIDKWIYSYSWDPKGRRTTKQLEQMSPDAGLRYRPGEVEQKVTAHGMRFPNDVGVRTALLSRFWARRHFEVKAFPVHAVEPGERCWPGTIVRITDPTLVDMLGEYGVTGRLGVITSATHSLGVEKADCLLDLLIFADTASLPRYHAISARATAYDSSSRVLTVAENWLGIENTDDDWRDAPLFSEPNYDGIAQFGGAANVEVHQWNGVSWSVNLTGTVESTTSTTISLAAAGLAGTYYRDMDSIVVLRAANNQDAGEWPLQLYSPICDDAGEFVPPGGGTQDGYPWEP
jgi:hypothetical protein